ncbi:hypothetical protein [Micromonospora cathayae]|uniref:Uncharacterized protein n=1 Tax=Micromonospora cathayae TaxID=3028804 RepID=A0ABY7ZMN2_9ACTN|nr:hypothetical protein [Micromonospora sp. HUAS 3]WDZ83763.1 hypothetical protein PVK37_25365 [Micromonospora sp. HUAS 3]
MTGTVAGKDGPPRGGVVPGSGFTDRRTPVSSEATRGQPGQHEDERGSPLHDDSASPVRLALYAVSAGVIALAAGNGLGVAFFADNDTARAATLVMMMIAVGCLAGVLADPILSSLAAAQRRHRR